MNSHDRRLAEDAGMRRAREVFAFYTKNRGIGHGSNAALRDDLTAQLAKGGRNKKAAARIRARVMAANPCVQKLRINLNRSGIKIDMVTGAIGTHDRYNAEGELILEQVIYVDNVEIALDRRAPPGKAATALVNTIAISQHALARVLGRLQVANAGEAIAMLFGTMADVLQQVQDAHANGVWKPWVSFPVPWADGLLIVEVDVRDQGGQSNLIFEVRTFIDEGLLHPGQLRLRDHLIEDGLEALHHYPEHARLPE